jgi:hypothetical protein
VQYLDAGGHDGDRFAGVLMPIKGRAGIEGQPKVYSAHNVISD